MIRIGAYCRVSTDEQARGENVDAQVIEIKTHLKQYTQPYKVQWYIDDGQSGTLFLHERTDGRRLLADVMNNQLDRVIVVRVDRLAREDLVSQVTYHTFKKHNIELISIKEGFDYRTPTGRFMANTFSNFASYERVVLLQRFGEGRIKNAVKGSWNGGHIPFGYAIDDLGNFILNPETSEVYTLIKKLALNGLGANHIRQQLLAMGIPSPTGESIWAKRTIIYMLRNPFYLGIMKYMDISKEGAHPALITPEEYEAIQKHIDSRAHQGRSSSAHLLSGLIKCSCGTGYTIRYHGKYRSRRYCCGHKYETVYQCPAPLLDADSLEARVVEAIMKYAEKPAAIKEALAAAQAHSQEATQPFNFRRLVGLDKQITGIQKLIRKKDEMYASGILSDEQYEAEIKGLYERDKKLRAEHKALSDEKARQNKKTIDEKQYIEAMKRLKSTWDKWEPQARQQAVRELVARIHVQEDHLVIDFGQFTLPLQPSHDSRGCWWFK